VITFVEFLKQFGNAAIRSEGFLGDALDNPNFPEIRTRADLDAYFFLRLASAKTRDEARRFWDEYEGLNGG